MDTIIKVIDKCRDCPFYGNSMDGMYCKHPYWSDKGAYDCHIITNTTVNEIPEKCPLKTNEVNTLVRLRN